MEEIKEWLNGERNYQEGVEILLQFTTDGDLVELFTQEGCSPFKKVLLKDEMFKLFKKLQEPITQGNAVAQRISAEISGHPEGVEAPRDPQTPKMTELSQTLPGKTPGRWSHPVHQDAVEKELFDQWHPLFLEMNHLQTTVGPLAREGVTNPAKKEQAGVMALQILKLAKQCRAIYQKRDHYFTTGTRVMPAAPGEQYALEPGRAFKDMQNRIRYVNQMKKNLQKNPADENSKQLLAKHQAAIAHYKTKFNF